MIANLGAANNFNVSHFKTQAMTEIVEKAQYYYMSGFFLTHGVESAVHVASQAAAQGKTFCVNLAAPFVCQFFNTQLSTVIPYADIVFGNESEAEAFGQTAGLKDPSPLAVAKHISALPKQYGGRARTVVITQGENPTIVCTGSCVLQVPTAVIPKVVGFIF